MEKSEVKEGQLYHYKNPSTGREAIVKCRDPRPYGNVSSCIVVKPISLAEIGNKWGCKPGWLTPHKPEPVTLKRLLEARNAIK